MNKIIGISIIAAIFIALFIMMVVSIGIKKTALIWTLSSAIMALLLFAINLITT